MFRILLAAALSLFAAHASAAANCTAQATERKIGGAAKDSFMKKCESEAKNVCEGNAKERKLAGAAKDSFLKKCLVDAVAAK